MKTVSQITKELRAAGYALSQDTLLKKLAEQTPVGQMGRSVLYADNVVDEIKDTFKLKGEKKEKEIKEPKVKDSTKVVAMLEAICRHFQIQAPAVA